jgi:ubiquinone/menaquinone biosynthesis C-methylase UbiE
MRMTKAEKWFVNRRKRAERNVGQVREILHRAELHPTGEVLEIGCGVGAVSAFLATHNAVHVVGIDQDPEQVEYARRTHAPSERLSFGVGDASQMAFDEGTFDLVLSVNVLHHVPEWRGAIAEIARVLRPGGSYLWMDIVFPRCVVGLFRPVTKNYGLYTHKEIMAAFEDTGLLPRFKERFAWGLSRRMLLEKTVSLANTLDSVAPS